ncbi:MAG: tetratricopeptide repeat protein [Chitinispirillaceae bacterium]|nr:tetratricopeptide repeat protein [Chitinispirillaceae bacterium]
MKKFIILFVVSLFLVCTQKQKKEGIVRIGNTLIGKEKFEAFERTTRLYPCEGDLYFPAMRTSITHLVETEVLFRQKDTGPIKDSLKKTLDWKWKERYFPAQLLVQDYLASNLAIPDEKIKAYYEAKKDSFKVVIKGDSTKKDSSYYKPLEEVKDQIVDSLFLAENKPDSAFLKTLGDTLPDSMEIKNRWINYVRGNFSIYFMKKFYKELTGKNYPDSISEIFGEGKFITQKDFDIIISWIPEVRRGFYDNPEGKKNLIEWLVKWKVFSEYSKKLGRNKLPLVKNVLEWGWKLNVAYSYVSKKIRPIAESNVVIDTPMLLYSLYDDNGYNIISDYSSRSFANKALFFREDLVKMKVDSIIISLRKKYDIAFLQNDWKDIKNQEPAALLKKADSLRDSSKTTEAKEAYREIIDNFMFTEEALTALVELAKIQTEQQLYSQAIESYRKFLLYSKDKSKRCNTFFMIGFIYDEYLDKPLPAEMNYKWVLKNAPDCELADDAEFMILHLGEPMTGIEELREETKRQGRKIDFEDTEEVSMSDSSGTSVKDSTVKQ